MYVCIQSCNEQSEGRDYYAYIISSPPGTRALYVSGSIPVHRFVLRVEAREASFAYQCHSSVDQVLAVQDLDETYWNTMPVFSAWSI